MVCCVGCVVLLLGGESHADSREGVSQLVSLLDGEGVLGDEDGVEVLASAENLLYPLRGHLDTPPHIHTRQLHAVLCEVGETLVGH